jgi:sugar phosphate isomerase/epimerase
MDRLARNLKVVDSYAAEKNVRIMIEVINRYEINTFNTAEEVMNFLEHYDLPNCYAHLDTFHMGIEEEDPYEAIRRCGSRLGYFHLADNSRKYPGTGQIDFYRMLKALEEIDYNGYLSVECLPWPNHMEAAQNALSYMKETEQKKGA